MHELSIMTGVFESVRSAAVDAGATKVLGIKLVVGEMTEAIPEALEFAFDALSEDDDLFSGAQLAIEMVKPRSVCLECGAEYEHDRFHMFCPECDSFATKLVAGRDLRIESIEVDLPDDDEDDGAMAADAADAGADSGKEA